MLSAPALCPVLREDGSLGNALCTGQGGNACEGTGSAHAATGPSRTPRRWRSRAGGSPGRSPGKDAVWTAPVHKPAVKAVTRGPHLQPSHDTHPRRAPRPLPGLPVSLLGPFRRQHPSALTQGYPPDPQLPPARQAQPGPFPPKMADTPSPPPPRAGGGRRGAAPRPGRAGPGSPRPAPVDVKHRPVPRPSPHCQRPHPPSEPRAPRGLRLPKPGLSRRPERAAGGREARPLPLPQVGGGGRPGCGRGVPQPRQTGGAGRNLRHPLCLRGRQTTSPARAGAAGSARPRCGGGGVPAGPSAPARKWSRRRAPSDVTGTAAFLTGERPRQRPVSAREGHGPSGAAAKLPSANVLNSSVCIVWCS